MAGLVTCICKQTAADRVDPETSTLMVDGLCVTATSVTVNFSRKVPHCVLRHWSTYGGPYVPNRQRQKFREKSKLVSPHFYTKNHEIPTIYIYFNFFF